MKRLTISFIVFIAIGGCQKASQQAVVAMPELDISFELTDETGSTVTAEEFRGALRLVFFGFASCPDICPITLRNVGLALDALGPLADEVTVLFISVDPKRDTPDVLGEYTDLFHPAIVGLSGTYDQLTKVTTGFRTTFGYTLSSADGQDRPLSREEYESLPAEASYFPFHSSKVYLIGPDDELLDIIGYGSLPTQIEETLREHL
jgi:cytochrome oxidase Cu insertion factor (SCO1/SenC/PrrC family)